MADTCSIRRLNVGELANTGRGYRVVKWPFIKARQLDNMTPRHRARRTAEQLGRRLLLDEALDPCFMSY